MVARLPALLHHVHGGPGIAGGGSQDLLQVPFVDVVRARAGHQAPAGGEDLERAQVDLLVPAAGLLDRGLASGEGGRVEDDGVEALARVGQLAQEVEDVGLARGHVGEAVELRVAPHARHRLRGDVDGQDLARRSGRGQAEAAVVGEGIEHTALRVAARHAVVLALVEEQAGLLPMPEVGLEAHAVLGHRDRLRHLAVQHAHLRGQPLEGAHARVVALQDPARREHLDERGGDLALQRVRRLRQRLHHEVVAVAVHHEGRQAVAFAVDDPVRLRPRRHRLPPRARGLEALAHEGRRERLAALDHAEPDLGERGVEREPQRPAAGAEQAHDGARPHAVGARHVGAEDPGMAGAYTGLAALADDHGRMAHHDASYADAARRFDLRFGREASMENLARTDPEVAEAIRNETRRQGAQLELIASENFVSEAVLEALGTVLTNKYAEGYPGKRYYGGCEFVDVAESLAIPRAKQLFSADHANLQPHPGPQANMSVD